MYLNPTLFPPDHNSVRFDRHAPEFVDSPQSLSDEDTLISYEPEGTNDRSVSTHLENGSTFENDQHEQRKQRVIPVLVHAPKSRTKHLKDKERSDGMFRKQFTERRNWNVENVFAVRGQGLLDLGRGRESFSRLKSRESWRRDSVAGVRDAGEGSGRRGE